MARRHRAQKRDVIPDPVYNSVLVSEFINRLMKSGKKSTAEKILYSALEAISENLDKRLEIFAKAIENVSPLVEVKAKRVGGSTYQIPVEVRSDRRLALAIRWVIEAARSRTGKSMGEKLSHELREAAEKRGAAVKKKEEVHRMAEANKAFSHIKG